MTVGTGDVLDGRYELLERLGQGGMGSVFRAIDERLDREVAVKVLDGVFARDPEFLARFQREARAAASLSHPGVVAVFDRGEYEGAHYIVMELIDGPSLADVLRSQGPLDPDRVLALGAVIADALGAAHRVGLVHRDVKPSNVLVTPDGHVKVTDFGIARATSDVTLTTTDAVLGSVPYVAPEQVRGDAATPASDVYALGCLLYALVTGEPPFRAEAAVSVLHQHLSDDPEPPSAHNDHVSAEVEDVILRLLAKDPIDRPADGGRAAALLRHAAGSAPEVAPVLAAEVLERTRRVVMPTDHTRVLGSDPTVADVAAAADEQEADAPIRWDLRLAFLVGIVALLVLVAVFGERLTNAADEAPLAPPSAPATTDARTPDPTPEPSQEPSPEPTPDTIDDVVDRIGDMLTTGRGTSMTDAAADKLADRLFKVVQAYTEADWEEARSRTEDLGKELQKRTDAGDITAERSADLATAIAALDDLLAGREQTSEE